MSNSRSGSNKGPNKDSTAFKVLRKLEEANEKRFNEVNIQRKVHKDNKDYYAKILFSTYSKDPQLKDTKQIEVATRELIAQELFRLYIPAQPKTRLIIDQEKEIISVGSEEVKNLRSPLVEPDEVKSGILSGKYTGLGNICVLALWMNEHDFKPGNVVLSNNRFIKLDGDWAFYNLRENVLNNPHNVINETVIADLPFAHQYEAFNWLNHRIATIITESPFLDARMSNYPGFRREVNEQMLQILLTPPELLTDFVAQYQNSFAQRMNVIPPTLNFLLDRSQQLMKAALNNSSFLEYVESNEAKIMVDKFKENLASFKTSGKNFIITSNNKESLFASIDQNFLQIQATASVNNLTTQFNIPPPPSRPPPPTPK